MKIEHGCETRWNDLPSDAQAAVLSHLSLGEVARVAVVGRGMDQASNSDLRWRVLMPRVRTGATSRAGVGRAIAAQALDRPSLVTLQRLWETWPAKADLCTLLSSDTFFDACLDDWAAREVAAGVAPAAAQDAGDRLRQARQFGTDSLTLSGLPITSLPGIIGQLTRVKWLSADGCHHLHALPHQLSHMQDLRSLLLTDCSALKEIPSGLSCAPNLSFLGVSGCRSLKTLPPNMHSTPKLDLIMAVDCGADPLLCESSKTALTARGCRVIGGSSSRALIDRWWI